MCRTGVDRDTSLLDAAEPGVSLDCLSGLEEEVEAFGDAWSSRGGLSSNVRFFCTTNAGEFGRLVFAGWCSSTDRVINSGKMRIGSELCALLWCCLSEESVSRRPRGFAKVW